MIPDAAPLLELILAFRRSKTLFAAVELGVFEGRRPAGPGMIRLLEACVSMGLLSKTATGYVNTPLAEVYLRRGSAQTLTGYIRYSNIALYRLWTHLEDAVVEGRSCWSKTFGSERGEFVRRTVQGSEIFHLGMHGLGMLGATSVLEAFNLSRFEHLVDLGGGTGHLAVEAKQRYPHMRVTVFDLAPVIEIAKKYVDVDYDVELTTGDFEVDQLPNADLFVLARILHNRSEERGLALLRRVWNSLPSGGGVLIAERLLSEDGDSVEAHMDSLNMLVCTGQGRERSASEYASLLRDAGFSKVQSEITGGLRDVVMGIK